MLTFLFWNIQKKPLLDRVARLAARHAVDVLMLAECDADPAAVLAALGSPGLVGWRHSPIPGSKVQLFTRLPSSQLVAVFGMVGGRLAVYEFRPAASPPVVLGTVHLVSPAGGWTSEDQATVARRVAEEVERIEGLNGGRESVLVGDFNMSPFDPGMVNGFVFHALMTRELAERRSARTVQHEVCRRSFFNPMWRFLTDRGSSPAGTYYRDHAAPVNHYWYTLDQVLVRPGLADKLKSVDILDNDGADRLTHPTGGWPDTELGSDHLPLLFTLDV